MTLRRRTLFLVILICTIFVGFLYSISTVFLEKGFEKVEQEASYEELQRVNEAFNAVVSNLLAKSADWAIWSDTYNYVQTPYDAYKDANLNDVSFGNLQINHMFLINNAAEFVYAHSYDYVNNKPLETNQWLKNYFAASSDLIHFKDINDMKSGLLSKDGQLTIFAARPILTSEKTGPIHGALVFARDFDQQQLLKVADVTKANLEFVPINEAKNVLAGKQYTLNVRDLNTLDGYVLLNDYFGKPAIYIKVTIDRAIAKQARLTKRSIMVLLFVMTVLFFIIFISFLNHLLFSRIFDLSANIANIDFKQTKKRLPVQGTDEIDQIADKINGMLNDMESSNASIRDREEMLRKKDWQLLESQSKNLEELQKTNELMKQHSINLEQMQVANLNIMEDFQQAQKEAEEANHAKSQFLANMSHEIRTPLNAILGFSDLLTKTSIDAEQKKYLDTVTSSSQLLLSIINDILDISKIEAGKIVLEHIDFNVMNMVDNALTISKEKVFGKNVVMRQVIEADVPKFLKGDQTRISQILVNLLSNAAKFTEVGEIVLTVKREPSLDREGKLGLWFLVKDTGIGIPQDKIGLLFKAFNQADSSTTRKFGGTGLGLAICKNLVEMMDGKIWIESKSGEGSVFQFTILLPEGQNVVTQEEKSQHIDVSGVKVLVVEDSKPNQDLIKAYFKMMKIDADFANNGQEAIDRLKVNKDYALVLMDMQMPVMGGIEATQIIRRDIDKELPIIALTAAALKEDQERCLASGMNDFLTKPIEINKLKGTIAKFANRTKPMATPEPVNQPVKTVSADVDVDASFDRIAKEIGLGKEDYIEILRGALDLAEKDLGLIEAAVSKSDRALIKSFCHRLKGTFANLRLNDISELMKESESLAQNQGDLNAIIDLICQCRITLGKIEKALG